MLSTDMKAVVDVILGEASYKGSAEDIKAGMRAIADVMVNRSKATGESLYNVTRVQSQFNAQSPAPGSNKYRDIAEQAVKDAQTKPSTVGNALYYATPVARNNLPKGLTDIKSVNGHIFATDLQGRGIITRTGAKSVDLSAIKGTPADKTGQFAYGPTSMNFNNEAVPRPNPDFRPVPKPQSRPDEPIRVASNAGQMSDAVVDGPINVENNWKRPASDANAYFTDVPNTPEGNRGNGLSGDVTGIPTLPSAASTFMMNRAVGLPIASPPVAPQQAPVNMNPAPRPVQTTSVGPDPRDVAERNFAKPTWQPDIAFQRTMDQSRAAMGRPTQTGGDINSRVSNVFNAIPPSNTNSRVSGAWDQVPSSGTSMVGNAPATRPGYQAPPASTPSYTSQQFSAPGKDTSRIMPTPAPVQTAPSAATGGTALAQAGEFAYGPTSINFNQAPPIPIAKPPAPAMPSPMAPVPQPAPQAAAPSMFPGGAPPIPTPMPAQQGMLQQILGGMNTSGMVGGALGSALGGPVGGMVGRILAPKISRSFTPASNNSIGTGSNSGGPYQGQVWRNTSSGGVRTFNPSTRQYEDYGGSNAGNRSTNQQTGSSSSSGGGIGGAISRAISSIFG